MKHPVQDLRELDEYAVSRIAAEILGIDESRLHRVNSTEELFSPILRRIEVSGGYWSMSLGSHGVVTAVAGVGGQSNCFAAASEDAHRAIAEAFILASWASMGKDVA